MSVNLRAMQEIEFPDKTKGVIIGRYLDKNGEYLGILVFVNGKPKCFQLEELEAIA